MAHGDLSREHGRISRSLRGAAEGGCGLVYLGGSFVTAKGHPGDFDACCHVQDVEDEALDPVFRDFSRGRGEEAAVLWRVLSG